jgi:xylulokinase
MQTGCLADSAALGAALRAVHGWVCKEDGAFVPMASVLEHANTENAFQCNLQAKMGTVELHDQYGDLAAVRVKIEQQLLDELHPHQTSELVQ